MNNKHHEKYIITTEQLKMKPLNMEDVENLMKIFSDPVTMQYYPSTKTRDEVVQWIQYAFGV